MTKTFANGVTCVHLAPVRCTHMLFPLCRAFQRALVGRPSKQAGGRDATPQHAGAVSPWLSWAGKCPSVSDGLAGVPLRWLVSPCLASASAAPFAGDVSHMFVPGGGVSQP